MPAISPLGRAPNVTQPTAVEPTPDLQVPPGSSQAAAGVSTLSSIMSQLDALSKAIRSMVAALGIPPVTGGGMAHTTTAPASVQRATTSQGPVEPDSTATSGPLRKVPGGPPASSPTLAKLAPEIGTQVASDNRNGTTVTSGILDDVKGGNRATGQAGLARAIEVAKKAHPSGKVGEVDLEPGGGKTVYKVDVGADEVWIDQNTFQLVKVTPAEK